MSATAAGFIPVEDPEAWRAALRDVPHAFGHTWENCRAMQLSTGWPTFLYTWTDGAARVVCPVAERPFREHRDIVTPYGLSGFAGDAADTGFLDDWRHHARERGWVCAFIALHPIFQPSPCLASPEHYVYNDAFILDLDKPLAELHDALSENRRRQLKAFDAGSPRLIEDHERVARFFVDTITDFYDRKRAAPVYSFSPATLEVLLALDNVMLLGGGTGHEVEAAVVFGWTGTCAEYLFGVSSPAGRRHSAALLWEGALRLRAIGIPKLNLGGGVRRGDGVAGFKARFGARQLPLGCLKQVFDAATFRTLARDAGVDPDDRTGYFPPFRTSRTAVPEEAR